MTLLSKRSILPFVLAALLLLAQQAALVHATWHAQNALGSEQGADKAGLGSSKQNKEGKESKLCVFDAALGQMLGGACSHAAGFWTTEPDPLHTAPALYPYSALSSVPFFSRGPPVFS